MRAKLLVRSERRARLMLPLNVLAKIENYNRFRHLFEGLTHNKIYVRQERSEYL